MKKKTIDIGFPMEYEDDDHVCHYGIFLRENEVKAVEEKIQELQRKDNIIDKAIDYIDHELNGHILLGDEETWNKEYYTNNKLDYKKLCIVFLEDLLNILRGKDK